MPVQGFNRASKKTSLVFFLREPRKKFPWVSDFRLKILETSPRFSVVFFDFSNYFLYFQTEHKGEKCVLPLNPNTSQENSQLISLALKNSGGQSMNPYLCSGISQFGHDPLGPILIQYIKTNSLSV